MFPIFYYENTINIANMLCFICFLCLLLDLIPEVKYYACYQGGDNLSKSINKLMSIHFKDIVFNLFKCCVTFYVVYYAVGSLVFASFRQQNFDGKIPFDFKTWIDLSSCCSNYKDEELVNLISMLISYLISGVLFGIIVMSRVWDYAITITVFHVLMCCLVMLDLPKNWFWWVCLGCGLVLLISVGEAIGCIRRKKALMKVSPEPSTTTNYLYKKS